MINKWVVDAISATGVAARLLPSDEVYRLIAMIVGRYTKFKYIDHPLWEKFYGDVSRKHSDGWSLICDYPEPSPIMLFEDQEEFRGFEFTSPESMRSVLADSPGFEFYVTNRSASFVLCYNHHEFIIGVGKCYDWLSAIEEE